jgi:hypothetical protein
MDSTQTLHDFVLNLLTNSEARSAFELDPEGTLNAAGLGDITAADVQDVVPLVVDYAPVQGITGLVPTGDLGLGALDAAPTSAIDQLQTVTNQLVVGAQSTTVDVNAAAVGAIAVDSTGFSLTTTSVVPGIGIAGSTSGVAIDLSGVHDVADTLDSDVVGPVTTDATGTVDGTLGTADGLVGDASVDGVLGTTDYTVNTLTSQVSGTTDLVGSVTSGLGVPPVELPELDELGGGSLVGGVTGTVDSTLDGVGAGGLLSGDASLHGTAGAAGVHGSAEINGSADAGATSGGLLGVTDILF